MTDIQKKIESYQRTSKLIKYLQSEKAKLEDDILKAIQEDVASQLQTNDYGTGTANVTVEETKIKVTVSKKISYDQDGLKKVFYDLRDREQNPEEYIVVKYEVAEIKYKNWPTSLQELFKPYRTVEASKPKIEIEA